MPTPKVERIRALVYKEMAGQKLDPAEKAELDSWLDNSDENKTFYQEFKDWRVVKEKLNVYTELKDWNDQNPFVIDQSKRGLLRRFNGYWLAAASVLLICVVVILYVELTKIEKPGQHAQVESNSNEMIVPARQQAMLTVTGGSTYILDSVQKGEVVEGVIKEANGSLQYLSANEKDNTVEHKVSTPAGGFYNLVLVDGTHVWLNASSSLSFNPVFAGETRKVRLSGEAFFAVKKGVKKFEVVTDAGTVSVYGTTFNVKSYDKEMMIGSLEEGSVKVENSLSGKSRMLKPGNQIQIEPSTGDEKFYDQVDLQTVSGWKNGLFAFAGSPLPEVLKELERWYDISAVYNKNQLPKTLLTGTFDRTMNLEELVKLLERVAKVKMKVTDHSLIVQP